MRNRILLLAAVWMTGCAAEPQTMPVVTNSAAPELASAALVFDAPITLDQPPIYLSRANRGPAAFYGFEDISVSSYDVITDNRQSTGRGNWYLSDTFSEQSGSTRR